MQDGKVICDAYMAVGFQSMHSGYGVPGQITHAY